MKSKQSVERFKLLYILFLVAFFQLKINVAQERLAVANLVFKYVSVKNGLSNNTVNSLYKDSNGFLWAGTSQALDRYDGISVKRYPLPRLSGYITTIQEFGPENLLIGTEDGLKVFNRMTETFTNFQLDHVTVPFIKYIHLIDSTSFLIGSENGLYHVQNNKAEKIFLSNSGSQSNNVVSIAPASSVDSYWIATQDGIFMINLQSKSRSSYLNTTSNEYMCMHILDEYIYLGTYNKGVVKFSTKNLQFSDLSLTRDTYIKCIAADQHNNIYIGTDGKGVIVYSPKTETFSKITTNDNLITNINSTTILSIVVDHNTLWLATHTGGINYSIFTSNIFQNYQFSTFNSAVHYIRSFLVLDQQKKIIGTREGLIYINEKSNIVKRFRTTDVKATLRSDIITHIYPYQNEQFIVGTFGGGVYLFDLQNQSLKKMHLKSIPENCSIFRITKDQDGNIWLATDQGLICLDRNLSLIKKLDTSNSGLTNNTLGYLICDVNNCLWASSPYGGLFFIDLRSGIVKPNLIPSPYDTVIAKTNYIYEDTDRNIWLCTNNGLLVVNPSFNKIQHYTSKNLLPHDVVKNIVQDQNGCFWITTLKGIVKFDYKNDQQKLFVKDDGIINYNFNNVVQRTDDGRIWWSNEQGLLYANPKAVLEKSKKTKSQHPPMITSIAINAKEASYDQLNQSSPAYTKLINLSSDNNDVSFSFSLMSYSLDDEVQYDYMLEGYDSTWISSTKNQASYYNLPAGNYTFKLRNPSNTSLETSLDIHVSRNYNTYLLYIAFITLSLLSVYLFVKNRQKEKTYLSVPSISTEVKNTDRESIVRYSTISSKKADDIQLRLQELMDQKQYVNADLKAQDLAILLKCSTYELSQVFSSYLNTNFNDYINNFRFREFTSLLTKENLSKFTLDALSEQCGFKSRSTFYRTVKKETGKSPMEYVKEVQKGA